MLADNLRLLALLYVRPRKALAGIVDEGSLLFASLAVIAVSMLLQAAALGALFPLFAGLQAQAVRRPPAVRHPEIPAPTAPPATAASGEPGGSVDGPPAADFAPALVSLSLFGVFGVLVSLAALYVPATILLVTLFDRVGSFGVAMRRDYGPLLACALMSFVAAVLPAGLLAMAWLALRPGPLAALLPLFGACVYFGVLMVLAVRTVMGASAVGAVGSIALSWLALLLQPFLAFLASPFILYYAYLWLRGDLGDVLGSWGQRQSFRRYLDAATVNPRDAEAHYQLGLIHLQRHQQAEAAERFRKAVEIDPGEIDAHFQLARLARAEGRWEAAIASLEEVLKRDPRHARHEAWREAGAVYVSTGAFPHARTVLERFVEARPYDPEGLYLLGVALRDLQEPARSREMFERCVEAARTAPGYRRGELREWRRKAEQALAAGR